MLYTQLCSRPPQPLIRSYAYDIVKCVSRARKILMHAQLFNLCAQLQSLIPFCGHCDVISAGTPPEAKYFLIIINVMPKLQITRRVSGFHGCIMALWLYGLKLVIIFDKKGLIRTNFKLYLYINVNFTVGYLMCCACTQNTNLATSLTMCICPYVATTLKMEDRCMSTGPRHRSDVTSWTEPMPCWNYSYKNRPHLEAEHCKWEERERGAPDATTASVEEK